MKLSKNIKLNQGFTLIELLVVIAILSILLVVVFAALNPAQRLADARDARRWNDVNNVLTALHECIVDNGGDATICGLTEPTALSQIGTDGVGCNISCGSDTTAAACIDLDADTDLDPYIASFPLDPSGATAAQTAYAVTYDGNGILTVDACSGEGATISVAR